MKAEGVDGQIHVLKDRILITRKGIMAMIAHGIKPSKEIPLASVSSVEFQDATRFSAGSLSIYYGGKGASADATVKFQHKANERFKQIKEEIFQLINSNNKS